MDLKLIKDIYNLHIKGFEGLDFNVISKDNYELTTDMEKYANIVMQSYQSGDEDDPYGDLDDGYRQGYMNYKEIHNDIKTEFYFVKVNDEIIGTTQSVYNSELYGIYSLALKKDYRGKGLGKEVLKKQLEMCRNKNIKVAYLQT